MKLKSESVTIARIGVCIQIKLRYCVYKQCYYVLLCNF